MFSLLDKLAEEREALEREGGREGGEEDWEEEWDDDDDGKAGRGEGGGEGGGEEERPGAPASWTESKTDVAVTDCVCLPSPTPT